MNYSDTCVILAAGKGSRMNNDIPKPLIPIAEKPIMGHIIDFWRDQDIKHFIFVVGYRKDLIVEYLESSGLKDYIIVIQPVQMGIADAILQIKDYVTDKFMVALGDCLNIGSFEYPTNMVQGYGIWDNQYKNSQAKGCNVIVVKDEVVAVYEKPPMDYAGIGTYFFDRRVFEYIKKTKSSPMRGEIDIADVMTNMVKDGQHLKAVPFHGEFINCTYPQDIEYANQLFKMGVKV
jgi:NDP-sugar pyrophosphorylase family protein